MREGVSEGVGRVTGISSSMGVGLIKCEDLHWMVKSLLHIYIYICVLDADAWTCDLVSCK